MPTNAAQDQQWPRVSELIAARLGLHFPRERQADLQRGLAAAAKEFGLADAGACADWVLSTTLSRAQLHALASHLTVGETYFFRERKTFEALAQRVIPELVQRRAVEKRLRVWSAACCTGEEAYSLAIALQQSIPNSQEWNISILATDINPRFLQKAATGTYGEWSFRECSPGFKESYFTPTADGRFAIRPQLKQWVRFAPLNLVDDSFPSFATDTLAMDLIFCRNVLMYFTTEQARKVAGQLRRALRDDGWLVISSGDGSQALSGLFAPVNLPGAILYRKKNVVESAPLPAWTPPAVIEPAVFITPALAATVPLEPPPTPQTRDRSFSEQARALADQGQLEEALRCCDRWISHDASDPAARYLHAVVLQELANAAQARRSLQQALYLDPNFVLAHFALGNLERGEERHEEARRHFHNALMLLGKCAPEELLPESDGLTAARLGQILAALLEIEAAA
jgi:chemotaxis protein methyltransferase CheR